jgi:hypothetical protein
VARRTRKRLVGRYDAIERAALERELRRLAYELRIAWRGHEADSEKMKQGFGALGSGERL